MYLCMSAVLVYPSTSRWRVSVCHLRRRVSVDPVWHGYTVVGRLCFDSYTFQSWARNPLIAAVTVCLASMCCVCMCVVVCEYARTGMAVCVYVHVHWVSLCMTTCNLVHVPDMHLVLYTVVLLGSDVTVRDYNYKSLTFLSTDWDWCNGKWVVVFGDTGQSTFLFYPFPFPPIATTCKTSASGPVETIGGAVHVEGDAWGYYIVEIQWCTVAVDGVAWSWCIDLVIINFNDGVMYDRTGLLVSWSTMTTSSDTRCTHTTCMLH